MLNRLVNYSREQQRRVERVNIEMKLQLFGDGCFPLRRSLQTTMLGEVRKLLMYCDYC